MSVLAICLNVYGADHAGNTVQFYVNNAQCMQNTKLHCAGLRCRILLGMDCRASVSLAERSEVKNTILL